MLTPAYIMGLGLPELLVILAIILLIFGPKKLPEIGKALGSTIRELRKSAQKDEEPKEVEEAKVEADGAAATVKEEAKAAQKEDATA